MIIKVTEKRSRSEADKKGSRRPRWGLGELDILSRVSDAKTLMQGGRGVCGTEIKCGWNLVSRGGIA